MENKLPEDSIQNLFYLWFIKMQEVFDKGNDSRNIVNLIEKFPKIENKDTIYKWKLEDGTEI